MQEFGAEFLKIKGKFLVLKMTQAIIHLAQEIITQQFLFYSLVYFHDRIKRPGY